MFYKVFFKNYKILSVLMQLNLEKLAESLAPGQGEKLIEIAQLHLQSKDDQELQETTNIEMVQTLKRIYDIYVQQQMPFIEQIRLLSLLPRSWKYEKIIATFVCSRNAVAAARRMHDDEEYMLNKVEELSTRQGVDPEKVKHFISWLVESNTLASGIN